MASERVPEQATAQGESSDPETSTPTPETFPPVGDANGSPPDQQPVEQTDPSRKGVRTVLHMLGGTLQFKATAIVIILLCLGSTLATAYYAWWIIVPAVWTWADGRVFPIILAGFATLVLACLPLWVVMIWNELAVALSDVKISEVKKTKEGLEETENETIAMLASDDVRQLVRLLRYSRAQLDAYYAMGLQQTRGSFRNAVIAMWLGFIILLAGLYVYIGPVEFVGLRKPNGEFTTVVLASAVIVEVIAALFLYTYRSTVGQLTFYYQLQMSNHAAIQCFSIANTMGDDKDAAKRAVIDRALANSFAPERLDLPTSKGLASLIPKLPG